MRFLESSDSETESRLVVARGCRGGCGGGESVFNGDHVAVWAGVGEWGLEAVPEMGVGDGRTTVGMCFMPLNATLKMMKMACFILWFFSHNTFFF